jgi:transcriptional regulator with XRE-family HTH domain
MAKNKAKSENLLNSIVRIDYLLQEGFTRKQLADMLDIQYGTLSKIIRGFSKDIKDKNYNKIKKLHSDYIIHKSNENYFDDEEVIDSQDAEEGVKEIKKWLYTIVVTVILLFISLWFILGYIIGLF